EEFSILASGKKTIGENKLSARLHAETLDDDEWRDDTLADTSFIKSLVKVHRLCEVSCLYGFTRIEPAPSPFDEVQEDITLEVQGQSLADKVSWLPAMEQFGEGLFFNFDIALIRDKVKSLGAGNSLEDLKGRYDEWYQRDVIRRKPFPGYEYVFVHSLSHLLIEQISLDAGYPSTALSERIYALQSDGSSKTTKLGLLLYAAGGGSQGTLGGLLEQAKNIPLTIKRGIARNTVCGNDPICTSGSKSLTSDIDMINGAACHGCLFTAETSCERRNTLLDRQSLLKILGN
ncbi:Zn-binding domain-containing protein, partial [Roseibium sp.]